MKSESEEELLGAAVVKARDEIIKAFRLYNKKENPYFKRLIFEYLKEVQELRDPDHIAFYPGREIEGAVTTQKEINGIIDMIKERKVIENWGYNDTKGFVFEEEGQEEKGVVLNEFTEGAGKKEREKQQERLHDYITIGGLEDVMLSHAKKTEELKSKKAKIDKKIKEFKELLETLILVKKFSKGRYKELENFQNTLKDKENILKDKEKEINKCSASIIHESNIQGRVLYVVTKKKCRLLNKNDEKIVKSRVDLIQEKQEESYGKKSFDVLLKESFLGLDGLIDKFDYEILQTNQEFEKIEIINKEIKVHLELEKISSNTNEYKNQLDKLLKNNLKKLSNLPHEEISNMVNDLDKKTQDLHFKKEVFAQLNQINKQYAWDQGVKQVKENATDASNAILSLGSFLGSYIADKSLAVAEDPSKLLSELDSYITQKISRVAPEQNQDSATTQVNYNQNIAQGSQVINALDDGPYQTDTRSNNTEFTGQSYTQELQYNHNLLDDDEEGRSEKKQLLKKSKEQEVKEFNEQRVRIQSLPLDYNGISLILDRDKSVGLNNVVAGNLVKRMRSKSDNKNSAGKSSKGTKGKSYELE